MNLKRVIFLTAMIALCAIPVYAAWTPVVAYNGNLDDSGTFDVANTSIIVAGTPTTSATITLIKNGYAAGAWTGTGIQSSSAAANHIYALAPISLADYQALKGTTAAFYGPTAYPGNYGTVDVPLYTAGVDNVSTLPVGSTLIRFTYMGDVNVDGLLSSGDLTIVKNSIASGNLGSPPTVTWLHGNLNYDTVISSADLTLVKNAIATQNLSGAYTKINGPTGGGLTPIPEPSTIALLFLGFASLFTFKKFWK